MKKIVFFCLMCIIVITVQAHDNSKGYRGYADLGYTIGVGDYEFGRFEISTAHGYQVNPYFFFGGGVGFHFMQSYETKNTTIALDKRDSKVSIPLFANFRGTLSNKKVAPFLDLKLGYFVTNNDGFYGNISIGCRMELKAKQFLSLSVGYVHEKLEFETFNSFLGSSVNKYTRKARKLDCEGISLKLGYEF